ncbi:MAG TPA: biotin/lipoyl-binding protein [Polyangiaceae bacterium]
MPARLVQALRAARGTQANPDTRDGGGQFSDTLVSVAARVSGQVRAVLLQDNQKVHEGDVLVELTTRSRSLP